MAAGTPESGIGTMTSAGAGDLERKLNAHLLANVVDAAAADDAVRAREVDVLEDARARRALREWAVAFDAVLGDDDDLAVLDLAHELGADDVERAGLGGEHVGFADAAQDQRTDTDGVAGADQRVVGKADEGIGAFDLADGLDEALDDAPPLGARQQMEDDFGVGGRVEDGAGGDQLLTQRQRVGQVAVVGDGEAAGVDIGKERLHILQRRLAGGGVAVMADGDVALEATDDFGIVEVVADEAEAAFGMELVAVEGR